MMKEKESIDPFARYKETSSDKTILCMSWLRVEACKKYALLRIETGKWVFALSQLQKP
ncbi:hypothetical protein KP509_06G077200 [Ceratopteris richardii]|uniref:Uncharacterized protein n=1 Tax=Ceratopteris richardii TaxID=49495 RepID=A0A8T2UHZ8_CERRI|nr:hypothetical protein KP509_06G077200 [Ceratopteris richardii]